MTSVHGKWLAQAVERLTFLGFEVWPPNLVCNLCSR